MAESLYDKLITFNVYKQEPTVKDMTSLFNGRVGDQGVRLAVRWVQGVPGALQEIDVIERKMYGSVHLMVGNGIPDGQGDINMDVDASGIDIDSDPANNLPHGITVFKLPQEAFPKDGFAKGYFALKDELGNVWSSIDVWFKVKGGVPYLAAKVKYFSDEWNTFIAMAKKQNDDFANEMRDAYNQQVTEAQNALTKATANLVSLAANAGNIDAQIKAEDIVKRKDFADLTNQVTDKLVTFDAQPKYYANADEMRSNNPNGTDSLCVTLNDNHRWVYRNKIWQDCGAGTDTGFNSAKEESQNLLYGQSVINWQRTQAGTFSVATENFAKYEDQGILHMHSDSINQYVRATSPLLTVLGHTISIQFPECVRNISNATGVSLQIDQFSDGDDPNNQTGWEKNSLFYNFSDSNMVLWQYPNIALNGATTKIRIQFVMHNVTGDVFVGTPVVNYGDKCIPYSKRTLTENLTKNDNYVRDISQDLLYGITIDRMLTNTSDKVTTKRTGKKQFPNRYMVEFTNNSNDWASEITPLVSVRAGEIISAQVPGRTVSGNVVFVVREYADKWGNQKLTEHQYQISNRLTLNRYRNIQLGATTNYVSFGVAINGQGTVTFGMPKANYGSWCIAYDGYYGYDNSNNLLGEDVEFDSSQQIFTLPEEDATDLEFDTVNHHAQYPTLKFIRVPVVSGKPISYQVPYQSSGNIWVQLRYSSTMDDNTQTNITQKLSPVKDKTIYKAEGVTLPEGTKSIGFYIWPEDNETGTIGLPKVNYGNHCMPYDKYGETRIVDPIGNAEVPSIARMYITSGSQNYKKIVPFKYVSRSVATSGYLSFDIQGNSSRDYEKKNLKIKLFKDPKGDEKLKLKVLPSWKKNSKFNLKANWIDATQARNIVNARLIKDAVTMTPLAKPDQTPILDTPDMGQINGVPVELYFDGDFFGLYTLNTKKDDVTFAMDSKDPKQEVISSGVSHDAFANANATIDGTNYEMEVHDTPSDAINANFTKFLQFINTASDDDFKAHIADYIDVNSVINEMLFGIFSHEYDFYGKSILLATWNEGAYWYMIPYDLDSTWGLSFRGEQVYNDDDYFNLSLALKGDPKAGAIVGFNGNPLLSRIYKFFKPEIKRQGQLLRSTVWSTQAIITQFRDFIDIIPVDSYKKEQDKWAALPSVNITSFNQIQSYVIKRSQEFDSFLSKLA